MRILLEDLDAGPMHQESVVQNEKIIVKDAESVALFTMISCNNRKVQLIFKNDNIENYHYY